MRMPDTLHFFTTNKRNDDYNVQMLARTSGRSMLVTVEDFMPDLLPLQEKEKALTTTQDQAQQGRWISPELLIKDGVQFNVCANVNRANGLVNGSEFTVNHIDSNLWNKMRICIWVEFADAKVGKQQQQSHTMCWQTYIWQGWTPWSPSITASFVVSTRKNRTSNCVVTHDTRPMAA